ncbi:MAG: hypothetical protein H0U43_07680 [Chthoniobacterales bacterium]|nr:hypothetical protein [Chthoniobacterales bacterium]
MQIERVGKTKRPRAHPAFKNLRVLPSGYQVTITRAGLEFSRHFAGLSKESLTRATRFRDKALRELPPKTLNPVPRAVLARLGMKRPEVGVFRHRRSSMYSVSYVERGRRRSRAFMWTKREEWEAYAAAVAFRRKTIRGMT